MNQKNRKEQHVIKLRNLSTEIHHHCAKVSKTVEFIRQAAVWREPEFWQERSIQGKLLSLRAPRQGAPAASGNIADLHTQSAHELHHIGANPLSVSGTIPENNRFQANRGDR